MFAESDVENILTTAYENEVAMRKMVFKGDKHTAAKLASVAKWLTSRETKPGLLLYGGVGNGKSTMAKAINEMFVMLHQAYADVPDFWSYTAEEKEFVYSVRCQLPTPVFVTAVELATLASRDIEQYESIKACRFLIIDDMGTEASTVKNFGTEVTPITALIYNRYDRMAPTVITSNLDDESIEERYSERVSDRFKEIFEKLNYGNKSYR